MEFLFIWIVLADSEGLPGSSNGKEYTCDAGDHSSIPGLGGKISQEKG